MIASARYRFGRAAGLSPVDLVLGWGAMSDGNVLARNAGTDFRRLELIRVIGWPNAAGHFVTLGVIGAESSRQE